MWRAGGADSGEWAWGAMGLRSLAAGSMSQGRHGVGLDGHP